MVLSGERAAGSAAIHATTSASVPTVSIALPRMNTLPRRISRRTASIVTTTSAPCTSSVLICLDLQTVNHHFSPRRHEGTKKIKREDGKAWAIIDLGVCARKARNQDPKTTF